MGGEGKGRGREGGKEREREEGRIVFYTVIRPCHVAIDIIEQYGSVTVHSVHFPTTHIR